MRMATLVLVFLLIAPDTAWPVDPKQVRLESIDFHGNEQFSDDRLRDLMAIRTPGFLRRPFYDPQVFQDDLENIRRFYIEQGFLEMAISRVDIDSVGTRFNIDITVAEGERTSIESITITGNEIFSEQEIRRAIPLESGDPFRSPLVQDGITNIMTMYGQRGYLGIAVNPDIRVNPDIHRARVEYIILEGKQYRVQEVRILGLDKTKEFVVTREIPLEPGEIFDYSEMLRGEQNLYATGLFTSVILQPAPAPYDSTERILLVRLRERKSGEFNIGGGWETIDGFRGTLNVQNNNLFGTARRAGFDGLVSQSGYRSMLSYMQPWTLGIRFRTDLNGLYEYRDDPAFDLRRYGVNAVFTRRIRPYTDANVFTRIERVRIENITGTLPDDVQRSNLRGLGLNLIYDTRDNLFNTLDGMSIESRNELVGTFLGGSDDFGTTTWTGRIFQRIGRSVLGTSLQVGYIRPFGGSQVPVSELFFTGGPNAMRGWEYQELGTFEEINGEAVGGRFLLVGSAELRFRIYSIFSMAIFFDAGNVWRNSGDFNTADIRYDAGLGPRISTPFGLIRGDFAFKLDRREGEKRNEFWFALGQAF
jgi:outer membrane protein insertion porin family